MTLNKEVFLEDPTKREIPNLGVAKVVNPRTPEEWAVLRYELTSFVCEGEYERGLERILTSYLRNFEQPQQPAVWVSGFYGSGKSHLVRVLEYVWRDDNFPDGSTARGLVNLPASVSGPLKELGTLAKRGGGSWAAAGTLGAGSGDSVRLAFLSVILRAAKLPGKIEPARFVLWLHKEGLYDQVKTKVEAEEREFSTELKSLYVSPSIASALLEVAPEFADSEGAVKELLKAQFPPVKDISDDELADIVDGVLNLVSSKPGRLPNTLVILDELQQFINDDPERMLQVQNIVEACSARFQSHVLFAATGQSALQATPVLQKLQGRFTVPVTLSDTDVESVVRSVVLRKSPDRVGELRSVLERVSGEIDRELAGTKIEPQPADADDLVPDYPILPARRRFWERALRAVDRGGGAGQLRTQLRMVHEAVKRVAERTLGTVVPADFLYEQQATGMLETGVLLRETYNRIEEQKDGSAEGTLKARLCALVFLISQLPTDPGSDLGVRATADMLSDLLVEDLTTGSGSLRMAVQETLKELAADGLLNEVGGGEFRLLTKESADWLGDFRTRLGRIKGDTGRIASDRDQAFRSAVAAELRGVTLLHGESRTPRKIQLHFGQTPPQQDQATVPVWVRDGWEATEAAVRAAAVDSGTESPIVFAWLPRMDSDELTSALAEHAAAADTLNARPIPATDEGREARAGMESRVRAAEARREAVVRRIVGAAKVYQGGGSPLEEGSFESTVRSAAESSLARLFPQFADADHSGWDKVSKRARDGSGDPLSPLGYKGEVTQHPVCKEILSFVSDSGSKGAEIRRKFSASPYGWPQDAIDGALLALVATQALSVQQNGLPVTIKEVSTGKVSLTAFFKEVVIPTALERIQIRQFLAESGIAVEPNQEVPAIHRYLDDLVALVSQVGGDAPLPESPPASQVRDLGRLVGNQLIVRVHELRDELSTLRQMSLDRRRRIEQRLPQWELLQSLVRHAQGLPGVEQVAAQMEAIRSGRALLDDPDPVEPILGTVGDALRAALTDAHAQLRTAFDAGMASLDSLPEWKELDQPAQQSIREQVALIPPSEIDAGTDGRLLATLERAPLADWSDKAAAIPHRVQQARLIAARKTEPEAQRYRLPVATLRSREDVDRYVDALRDELKRLIDDGPVVI